MQTFTITFCETAENHVGMEKIGNTVDNGFSCEELLDIHNKYPSFTEYYKLNTIPEQQEASILVIRNGLFSFGIDHLALFKEQDQLNKDKHALMKGRVCNKKARWNLCFSNYDQEPNYELGKGTVVNFNRTPLLNELRNKLPWVFGNKAYNLNAEGNYYYDLNQCYIGYHGDAERKRVIGVRLGYSMPLHIRWYINSQQYGEKVTIMLNSGDMYVFSEKAVGTDWKKRSIFTLRHAAGFNSKNFTA